MRFAMITTFYPPYNFGGDGIAVERLARALVRDGHSVTVVHAVEAWEQGSGEKAGPEADRRVADGIDVRAVRTGFGSLGLLAEHQLGRPVAMRRQIAAILDEVEPDVIHFHNVSLIGGPGVLRLGSAVKLVTFHEYWFVCGMHVLWKLDREACTRRECLRCTLAGRRPPQLWRLGGIESAATRQVDAWFAPSETAKRELLRNGFPHEIRILPHFVPDDSADSVVIEAAGSSSRARAGVGEGRETSRVSNGVSQTEADEGSRPYFLFVGRLERLKGIVGLVEIFDRYDRADLVIAGEGSLRSEIEARARDRSGIRLVGRVSDHDLATLYRDAVAVVAPSLCYETFGLTPLEGFAEGTPAIVSSGGALAELVETTGGGIVASSEDEWVRAMESLRTDASLRAELGERGRTAAAETFSERACLDRYYAIIDTVKEKTG